MNNQQKDFLKSSLPFVYLVLALFALRWTIVEPYVVPTGSMEPTLKTGDRLYALKCAYDVRFPFTDWILFRTGNLKRGDIILFKNPESPDITYVKRAIGLPGDKIVFRGGRLFVNGEEIKRELYTEKEKVMYDIEHKDDKRLYIETLDGVRHFMVMEQVSDGIPLTEEIRARIEPTRMPYLEVTVPADHFYFIGDNRDNSKDSRYIGFAPMNYLKGKAMFIWFSSWDWRVRPERIGTKLQ